MPELQVSKRKSTRTYEAGPSWFLAMIPLVFMTAVWLTFIALTPWAIIPAALGLFLLGVMVKARSGKRFAAWKPQPRAEAADPTTEARVTAALARRRKTVLP